MKHRYASHYIYVPGRGFLKQQGVEVENGHVCCLFSLEGEMAHVEWLPGILAIEDDGQLFHYFPFDFTTMQPVFGTQRRQLK